MEQTKETNNNQENSKLDQPQGNADNNKQTLPMNFKLTRTHYIFIGVLALASLFVAAGYYLKDTLMAASVNGVPVTRWEIMSKAEKSGGQQILKNKITEMVIMQQALKKGIVITQQEVNQEIEKIEENVKQSNQDLDALLELQGMTREELGQQIKIEKSINKLLENEVQVTEEEIDQYLEENKDTLPQEADPQELRVQVSEQLKQEKLGNAFQAWLENAKKEANIKYFGKYKILSENQ